jgi:hypothetical protein
MGGVSSSVRGEDLVCMVAWRGLKAGDFSSKGCVWKLCSPLSQKGVAQLKRTDWTGELCLVHEKLGWDVTLGRVRGGIQWMNYDVTKVRDMMDNMYV